MANGTRCGRPRTARSLQQRLALAGKTGQVTVLSYNMAGHHVCGTGFSPWLLDEQSLPTDTPPDPRATAQASAEAWLATVAFLRGAARF